LSGSSLCGSAAGCIRKYRPEYPPIRSFCDPSSARNPLSGNLSLTGGPDMLIQCFSPSRAHSSFSTIQATLRLYTRLSDTSVKIKKPALMRPAFLYQNWIFIQLISNFYTIFYIFNKAFNGKWLGQNRCEILLVRQPWGGRYPDNRRVLF